MNIERLKKLVNEANKIDGQNDVLLEENRKKRLQEMSKSLDETLAYLDVCSENELLFATEVLEDLAVIFDNKELIRCIEKNTNRCENTEIKKQLNVTLKYIKALSQELTDF